MRMFRNTISATALCALLLAGALPALAGEAGSCCGMGDSPDPKGDCCKDKKKPGCDDKEGTKTASAAPGASAGGLRAFVDEKGNRVAPTAAQAAAAAPRSTGLAPAIQVRTNSVAGGGKIANLGGQYMNATVATKGPDGRIQMDCVQLQPAGRKE